MSNPIRDAVMPLQDAAVARAQKEAEAVIARVRGELELCRWDVKKCAPYPSSKLSRSAYWQAKGRYDLFSSLTKWREVTNRHDQPCFVDMPETLSRAFVLEAREAAAAQYLAFVDKLCAKVGECLAADLDGDHVWGYSTLTVRKADGSVEQWKTEQIVNVSKLGKLFNQWPTRKLKS